MGLWGFRAAGFWDSGGSWGVLGFTVQGFQKAVVNYLGPRVLIMVLYFRKLLQ